MQNFNLKFDPEIKATTQEGDWFGRHGGCKSRKRCDSSAELLHQLRVQMEEMRGEMNRREKSIKETPFRRRNENERDSLIYKFCLDSSFE